MKKILIAIALSLFTFDISFAQMAGVIRSRPFYSDKNLGSFSNQIGKKRTFPERMTFYADYANSSITADDSVGSPTATFTASRSATNPATYIDSAGVVQLVTNSNIPRYQGGYYDTTGFHTQKGLMIEAAGTNLITISTDFTLWLDDGATTTRVRNVLAPDGSTDGTRITTGTDNDFVYKASAITTAQSYTFSVWLKGTGTVRLRLMESGGDYSSYANTGNLTLTSTWARYGVSGTKLDDGNNIRCQVEDIDTGETVDAWGGQLEASPYATSFIPTTTAEVTRNAEVLKYANLNNRTATQETIFIKFAPFWAGASPTTANRLLASDTKDRAIALVAASDSFAVYPNITDDATDLATQTLDPAINTSYVLTAVFKHLSPYAEIYSNGVSQGTYTTNDFTDPVWGDYFYIGSDNASANQLNGIIQKIAIFSSALSSQKVSDVTTIMQGD